MASTVSTTRRIYQATIERIVELAPETRAFSLRLPDKGRLPFVPGQFISCLLPIDGTEMIRPYSIASSPEDELLEICLNRVPEGPASSYLFGLGVGAALRFTGPWGTFKLDQAPAAECVFIAEGAAIAPIRPMLRHVLAGGGKHPVRLHYAARTMQHLLYRQELETLAATAARFTFSPLIDIALESVIHARYVASDNDRTRHFYICSVGDIVPRLRDLLRQAGYERRAVQYEKW